MPFKNNGFLFTTPNIIIIYYILYIIIYYKKQFPAKLYPYQIKYTKSCI